MAKAVGSSGPTTPTLLWVSGVLHHSFAGCLVDEGTKYDGILAFIGDAFSSLCHKFHGFGTKEACFEQV